MLKTRHQIFSQIESSQPVVKSINDQVILIKQTFEIWQPLVTAVALVLRGFHDLAFMN